MKEQSTEQEKESTVEDVTMSTPQNLNAFATGFGFDAMGGAFPNMNFGGDFSQMQMMNMQNNSGLMPNGFGFPMMGKLAPTGVVGDERDS